MIETDLLDRLHRQARKWGLAVDHIFETETSLIAFANRHDQPAVLKIVKQPGDEWHSGEILEAFDGNGVARVYEHEPGAMLLERLRPGNSLVEMSLNEDEEATDILAGVVERMAARTSSIFPAELPKACPTVQDWAKGFERYLASGDQRVPKPLVEAGQRVFLELCASQGQTRLLHGDLQHYNVLFDANRGWLAIDPKGVIAELEYETGAVLRNPVERPELFISGATIERRVKQFSHKLNLDYERMLGWAFSQAVLSAIWGIEDGFAVDSTNSALRLAAVLQPMLV